MNEYEQKKQARIDRYRERAEKARQESSELSAQSSKMASAIPFGQPVHGPADRRYRERIGQKMDQAVAADKKAEYYEHKARAAEKNNAISSDDPEALEKLQGKLERLRASQETMKRVNAYYRKHKTCVGCEDIFPDQAEAIDKRMENAPAWMTAPYTNYVLSQNNAEIHRIEDRIKELEHRDEIGFSGWEFDGGRVEANTGANRLQVFFDEIPSDEVRSELKHGGFHWSRSNGAWQRQLTKNAIDAASRIKAIQPTDGSDPRKIQPKRESKEKER